LAIDLGTSHTVAAVQRPGRPPQALLFDGSPVLPSGVFAARDGTVHTGRDAERLAQAEPGRFEPHPKRRIDEGSVLLGETEYPVAHLLAAVLRRVRQEAAHADAGTVALTCPADWGRLRRSVLREAARTAGFDAFQLIDEPVAAATYCIRVLGARVPPGQALLVFDFGGGTLDLALIRADPAGPDIVGVSGLEDLGGLDIDAALVGHLGHLIAARDPATWDRLARPGSPHELRDRRAFWAEVRAAKEMLSRATAAPVALPGAAEPMYLTREELERLAGPLVDRAVDETRRLLDGAGLHPAGLAAILLVGGSSRIPLVATRLHSRLGIAPVVPEQPELPVAHGALVALAAADEAPEPAPETPRSDPTGPRAGHAAPPAAPASGLPGQVSGLPGQVSGLPGQVSGVPAAPVSGAWSEQPSWPPVAQPAHPGSPGPPGAPPYPPAHPAAQPYPGGYPPAPYPRPPRPSRTPLIIGVVATVVVLAALAGTGLWWGLDALRDRGSGAAPPGGAGGAEASAVAARGPAPDEFSWCEGPNSRIFCPTVPVCFDADDDEIPCDEPHVTQLFAGGYLPSDAAAGGSDRIGERAEVKAACGKEVMASRSIDKGRTAAWDRYSQWLWVNGQNMFYCLAGPPNQGETTGSAFRTD
jgi:hypothetical protein